MSRSHSLISYELLFAVFLFCILLHIKQQTYTTVSSEDKFPTLLLKKQDKINYFGLGDGRVSYIFYCGTAPAA